MLACRFINAPSEELVEARLGIVCFALHGIGLCRVYRIGLHFTASGIDRHIHRERLALEVRLVKDDAWLIENRLVSLVKALTERLIALCVVVFPRTAHRIACYICGIVGIDQRGCTAHQLLGALCCCVDRGALGGGLANYFGCVGFSHGYISCKQVEE